jgi:hypothetical protein
MRFTCDLTVASLTMSVAAISAFERACAISRSTSSSRSVSSTGWADALEGLVTVVTLHRVH